MKTETVRRGLLEKTVWATVAPSAALACACAACAADVITYEEFGAAGDGKTDDMAAIVAAHAAANKKGLPVRAGDGRTYYIGGGSPQTADIRTDVDFGTASFVIDDREVPVEKREAPVFRIQSAAAPVEVKGITWVAPRSVSSSESQKYLPSMLTLPTV